jgi:hypothetical protein
MKKEEIEKIIHMNQRLLLILGYGSAVMMDLMDHIKPEATGIYKNEGYAWFMQAIENLVYLDKSLPPMP